MDVMFGERDLMWIDSPELGSASAVKIIFNYQFSWYPSLRVIRGFFQRQAFEEGKRRRESRWFRC
jgi:hypothetical protein